ncbi:hypothetical protein DYI24_26375, partial [Rhodopseudomonas sp. BR0C11]|nr:hypothetical protein [Rhodopseudomonas sp. BR0C11]
MTDIAVAEQTTKLIGTERAGGIDQRVLAGAGWADHQHQPPARSVPT